MEKDTERLLINVNHWLRDMRGMARRKSLFPSDLCGEIISDCTEALNEIKKFRDTHGKV